MTLGIAMMAVGLALMFVGCAALVSSWYTTVIQIERDQGEPELLDQQTLAQRDKAYSRATVAYFLGFVILIAGLIVDLV